jgi:hypothetical protein
MIAEERETSITYSDADEQVLIYTCRRPDITALKKKLGQGVTLEREGVYEDGSPFAYFRIPRALFSVSRAVRSTQALSPEQRAARSERMKGIRNRAQNGDLKAA